MGLSSRLYRLIQQVVQAYPTSWKTYFFRMVRGVPVNLTAISEKVLPALP